MALLIVMPHQNSDALKAALKAAAPTLDIRVWPEIGAPEDIEYVVSWKHPAGELLKYPNLKVIASYGAGVDHIFNDPKLPPQATITRLVDNSLAHQMAEYVGGVLLNHKLRLTEYREYQAASSWAPKPPRTTKNVTLLGLGNIGREVARYLNLLGYQVSGWSRSAKALPDVVSYAGRDALPDAVAAADYIVCLLPLTHDTRDILDRTLFAQAKTGAYLINAGRGGQLNEEDLMDAIYKGHISGACLDVFKTEPLPQDHPFWRHPKISITPHCASLTNIDDAVAQLLQNHRNMVAGVPLINQVDPQKGY
ncbi:2-hydroxyacid dehydrogenase [Paremcibacter congregatus]|uniref:2-hydroxyacid dehydrogenase n=1 Tax=Paremcibacter congregatus TaxID=2043170 RepID=UPI003A8E3E17